MSDPHNLKVVDNFNISNYTIHREILYHGDTTHIKPQDLKTDSGETVRPLAAAVLGLNNTSIPLAENDDYDTYWTDHDGLESYLNRKPTCYLILGQQGIGNFALGEALSKKKNCIHLCPYNIINDEIEQKSATGTCLDFNMKHNKVCEYDIIMSMLKKKLRSPAIKHRGYVISGFPLVTSSKNIKYILNKLYTEESYIIADEILGELLNFKKKKTRKMSRSSVTSEQDLIEGEEEEEEIENVDEENEEGSEFGSFEMSKFLLDSCNDLIVASEKIIDTTKSVILNQIVQIFELKPDIIINISCPYNDTLVKKNRKYFNYSTNANISNPFVNYTDLESRWPTSYSTFEYNKPFDSHLFNPKYNCRQPINFRDHALQQICNYKVHAVNLIEEQIKEYHPSKIINLDGRTTVHRMIYNTLEILSLMPIMPIFIPEPLYLDEPPELYEEFWNTVEELNVIRSGNINFNRHASLWYNRCPVELKCRRTVQGKTRFAVTFFKYVFIMASFDAMSLFCRNPRPYLKLNYLEPTCRVVILGTESSGKTMIAKCLSWLFDAPIISFAQVLKDESQKKYDIFANSILSEIIAIVEDKRFAEWEREELERKTNLDMWFSKVRTTLKTFVTLLQEKINRYDEMKSDEKKQFMKKYNSNRDQLSFLPIEEDLGMCENLLKGKNLLDYAPTNLTIETTKPNVPVLGDDDVSQEIAAYIIANNLQNDITPTTEEVMFKIITLIKENELESEIYDERIYGKFIIDDLPSAAEYWEYMVEAKLLPDYTIALFENREIDTQLIEYYNEVAKSFKTYYDRIFLSSDPLVKTKLLHNSFIDVTPLYVQLLVDDILLDALDIVRPEVKNIEIKDPESFQANIDTLRENWELIKFKLEENLKSFIEVEIEDKSDVQVLDEVLLKVRKCYCRPCITYEEEILDEEEDNEPKDFLTFNEPRNFGETSMYCPISFFDHSILWRGKPEFSLKYDNRIYCFSSEICSEIFQNDVAKYQQYSVPFKQIPPVRICIIGCSGSGKSKISKKLAKELGLLHIDFANFINTYLIPKHIKKVGWIYENPFTDMPPEDDTEPNVDEEEMLNKISEILFNEHEVRRLVYNYIEQGSPLPSFWTKKLLSKLWNESPYNTTGIVIDGYPKCSSDVEDMVSHYCIPDLIIELESDSETTLERLSPYYFQIWKNQLKEAKHKAETKFQKEKSEWLQLITFKTVMKLTIDDIINKVIGTDDISNIASEQSAMIEPHPSGLENVDGNLFATYNELIEEYPEPIDLNEWEKTDDARERINARLETSRVPVPDERFDYLCQYHKPASKVPAFLNVVDIAGLVRGAAEGQGLGNAFLSHIKACDAIFNLCRAFDDEDVIHVDGEVNPIRDLETIGEELRLKDEEQLMQNIEKLDRVVNRGNDKKLKPEYESLMRIKSILVDEKKHIRFGDWSAADIEILNKYLFLTSKPALYLVNLSEKDYIRKKNKWLPKLKEWIDKNDPGAPLVPFSGVLETKLFEMDAQEKAAFLKENNITSALDKIIVQGYKALQLEYFFTAGPDEVKAWTIQKGTKAPQAAGRIHTDFEKGFIMAEVMHFKDFKEEGTEAACKAAGKYRQQGRNYLVEDGDIIFFKFNAGAGLKDAKKK